MERNYYVRYWITEMIKNSISCANKNNTYSARGYIDNLRGMIHYMLSVGDIEESTYKKVYNLTALIVRKYALY